MKINPVKAMLFSLVMLSMTVRAELPQAPALVDKAGNAVSLSDYQGQALLINFWATWCAPCRQEMPDLDELYTHYGSEGVMIVGVAADELDAVNAFSKDVPVSYPILIGDADEVFEWSGRLGNVALGLPYSILVDAEGKPLWRKSGGRITLAEIEPVMEKLTASAVVE